jgi:hypothetical protein
LSPQLRNRSGELQELDFNEGTYLGELVLRMGMWHTLPASILLVSIDSDRPQQWSPDTRLSKRKSDSEHIDTLTWCLLLVARRNLLLRAIRAPALVVLQTSAKTPPKDRRMICLLINQGLQRMLPKPLPIQSVIITAWAPADSRPGS